MLPLENDLSQAKAIQSQFLQELAELVNIDSGTDDKPGVDLVGVKLQSRMEQAGFTVTVHQEEQYGNHLVGRITGSGSRHLLLVGHMDTVYPKGEAERHPFSIRDGKAYGPGIFDMKSGVLAAITALELAGTAILQRFASITMICNSDEEVGSPSSTPLIRSIASTMDAVLVFEPSRSQNYVVIGRKGIATYTLDVTGLSSHAGVTPDTGRNAILELSHLIIQLQAIHKSIATVSVNVGAVSGGGRRNVVPAQAQALFEMRAATVEAFAAGKVAIQAVIDQPRFVPDTTVKLTSGPEHGPLQPHANSQIMVDLASKVATDFGIVLHPRSIGGASDANTTGSMGIPTLDGLGLVGQHSHNPDEHIIIDEIPQRLAFIARLIRSIAMAEHL